MLRIRTIACNSAVNGLVKKRNFISFSYAFCVALDGSTFSSLVKYQKCLVGRFRKHRCETCVRKTRLST